MFSDRDGADSGFGQNQLSYYPKSRFKTGFSYETRVFYHLKTGLMSGFSGTGPPSLFSKAAEFNSNGGSRSKQHRIPNPAA